MHSVLFRPKMLVFHLVCIAGVVAMVNLSLWQFDRLDQRREFNARVESRAAESVLDVNLADMSDPSSLEWRRIGAKGTYRPEDEVLVLNRSQDGRAGLNVVTPLELDSGRSILVVRGFLPLGEPIPPAPNGTVTVIGTARLSEERRSTDLVSPPGRTTEFFRLDIARIDEQFAGDLVPVALFAQASDPPESSDLRWAASPTLTEGSHLSYAIQWLIFATALVVGWILAVRRTLRTHSRSQPSS